MKNSQEVFLFFFTNVKAFQFFHIARQVANILTAILLAKSTLTTGDIGIYELLMYIGFAFSFFWVTGFVQGMLAFYPKLTQEEKRPFIFEIYLLFSLFSLLLFAVLFFGKSIIISFFASKTTLPYYELFILFFAINLSPFLIENIFLLKDRSISIILYGMVSFGLHVLVVVIPVFWFGDFYWSFVGLIVLAIGRYSWLLILLSKESQIAIKWSRVVAFLSFCMPLVLYALVGGFMQIFDNWLVNYFYEGDESRFAVFRFGARELPLALAMASALSASLLPEVSKNLKASLELIRSKSLKLIHLLFPASILALWFSDTLFPIVFNESFAESATIFKVFLLILLSRLVFPHTLLIGAGENTFLLKVSVGELLLNVILSWYFVQYFGLAGIAMGSVIAYFFEKAIQAIFLYKKYNIRVDQYVNLKWYLLYSSILITSFVIDAAFF
ncbi:MAG: hypothetical protein GY705_00545 [Bacteroidetes bacterium]|nr:hypothetical protein [Bacteroidota bacterium]